MGDICKKDFRLRKFKFSLFNWNAVNGKHEISYMCFQNWILFLMWYIVKAFPVLVDWLMVIHCSLMNGEKRFLWSLWVRTSTTLPLVGYYSSLIRLQYWDDLVPRISKDKEKIYCAFIQRLRIYLNCGIKSGYGITVKVMNHHGTLYATASIRPELDGLLAKTFPIGGPYLTRSRTFQSFII